MKSNLKPPGTKRLKLNCDILLSTSAFKFNLRHYTLARHPRSPPSSPRSRASPVVSESMPRRLLTPKVGRCRLKVLFLFLFLTFIEPPGTLHGDACRLKVSKLVLKAPEVSALETVL